MSEKIQALGLVLLLTAAIWIGHNWADEALTFATHTAVVLALEIAISFFVGLGRRTPKG
ncbi:hypothetical protein [Leifsonia sp. 21MFCrub1.1]|uniref:hypothetical protein n=1 Tax=Leifsonia sp. 21MFCrub1.1 TaxID=1798223 RepID=UPI000892893E|nr:hypothetical protein [Leifsonia sp. 21MFCrub1.1]SEA40472.1 hypothetical protein SAMN04515680_0246 [Leifsonia sp. 21MFCrub1.1]